jgi:hypothetical protein
MIRIDEALLSSGLKAATITLHSLSNRATPESLREEINRRAAQFLQSLAGLNVNSLPAVASCLSKMTGLSASPPIFLSFPLVGTTRA